MASLHVTASGATSTDWSNPGNAVGAADGVGASATIPGSGSVGQLDAAFSGLSALPAGATIDGIEVAVTRRGVPQDSGDGRARDDAVLLLSGSVVGDNKADTATDWQTSYGGKAYGGPTDDWNAGLTRDDLADPGFRVSVACSATTGQVQAEIDAVEIEVWYTEAGGGDPGGTNRRRRLICGASE